jgi:hypothetical protein
MTPRRLDLAATLALLGLGVAGLIETASMPERAAQWPRAVLALLALSCAAHLAALLRGWLKDRGR